MEHIFIQCSRNLSAFGMNSFFDALCVAVKGNFNRKIAMHLDIREHLCGVSGKNDQIFPRTTGLYPYREQCFRLSSAAIYKSHAWHFTSMIKFALENTW